MDKCMTEHTDIYFEAPGTNVQTIHTFVYLCPDGIHIFYSGHILAHPDTVEVLRREIAFVYNKIWSIGKVRSFWQRMTTRRKKQI